MYLAISWLSLTYRNRFSGFLKICIFLSTGMGIYKRKNEKKRTRTRPRKHGRVHEKKNRSRKHALDQESVHEKRICWRKLVHEKNKIKLGEISINFTFNNSIWFVDPTNSNNLIFFYFLEWVHFFMDAFLDDWVFFWTSCFFRWRFPEGVSVFLSNFFFRGRVRVFLSD